jgi:Protein of unknown function (DUF3071)
MRTLRLVALSDDGSRLILTAGDPDGGEGERFELPVDDRVRAAARGDARRLGQMDVGLGNTLSPRVIQSRIRSGETPEQVAADSGTPVDRIMRFAHPVLQERSRIAEQAREARVRLSEGTLTVNLHQFMAERLRLIGTGSDGVSWDAHRSDDGTWLVTGGWSSDAKSGTVCWAFDVSGRTVTPSDAATTDFAEGTRLVRVVPDVPHHLPAAPTARGRAVAVIHEDEPAAAESADREPAVDDDIVDAVPAQEAADAAPTGPLVPESVDEAYLDELAEHDTVVLGRDELEDDDPRVRIPAWEDIVFGVRRHR